MCHDAPTFRRFHDNLPFSFCVILLKDKLETQSESTNLRPSPGVLLWYLTGFSDALTTALRDVWGKPAGLLLTDKQTADRRRLMNLLGGCNYCEFFPVINSCYSLPSKLFTYFRGDSERRGKGFPTRWKNQLTLVVDWWIGLMQPVQPQQGSSSSTAVLPALKQNIYIIILCTSSVVNHQTGLCITQ